jgi:hypothetical protein
MLTVSIIIFLNRFPFFVSISLYIYGL